ncbi:ATP-dependent zinc metalloprotease FtsH [Candidatus Parcubacteria bacterium]|nr:ATP-dependent zinc metalloprotease FtsH [Candidatus Parcubacteria bacterium]
MKALIKNLIIVLVIFLTIAGVFALFAQPMEKEEDLSLTQLVEEINQGKIEEIIVTGNELAISFYNGTKAKSRKETEAGLSESLLNYGANASEVKELNIKYEKEGSGLGWLLSATILLPLVLFFLFFWMIFKQSKSGAMQAFNFSKAKIKMFGGKGTNKDRVTFKDVAGLKEAKEETKEVVDFLKNPKKFLAVGAKIPRGVLFLGSPGIGKTLLAKAVAGESEVPFFHIAGSEFVEMFVGVGSSRVRDLFATAKKTAPSIIFIDELDAIGRHRGSGIGGGHDEREQTLNQILVEMDGFEGNTNVIVLAATNRPDVLDPALLRPGRFDRRIVLEPPDISDRKEVLAIHCKGKPLAKDVDLREVAERTPGFSGADLANVANEAAILTARNNKHEIFQKEFLEAIEKVLLGPERKSYVMSKKEKEITAYHEAGHALVSAFTLEAEPVRKISIIARGMAAGYTLKVPSEERRMKTKSEFLAEMAVLLGGYCTEQLKFNEITTGASNDLERASELARNLVKRYGMSSLGPVSFGKKDDLVFLGREISEQRNYSEETANLIDKEIAKFIKNAQDKANKVLLKNKKILERIAQTLVEKETIEKEEFDALIKGKKSSPKKAKPAKKKTAKKK